MIDDAGAKPSFLHYRPRSAPTPYPAVICASVNDAVVRGIPTRYRLVDGDLVSIDCGAALDGWHGDAAISFTVGRARPADVALIEATTRALRAGIAAARSGGRLGDIAHAVGAVHRAGRVGGSERPNNRELVVLAGIPTGQARNRCLAMISRRISDAPS
jgi:methionyl aminopeptidase